MNALTLLVALALPLPSPGQEPAPPPIFRRLPDAFAGATSWTEGIAFADVENDGDLDVLLARGEGWSGPGRKHQNGLWLNGLETGAFALTDASVERLGWSESHARDVAIADVDADGWIDAVFANGFNTAPPYLFMNRGEERPGWFRMESDVRGLTETLSSATAAFGDVDDDGDLDLVLADSGPSFLGPPGGRPRLYLNDGAGRFAEASERLAAPLEVGSMALHLADIDGDFDVDLFGPNRTDRDGHGHYLLLNDGTGHFRDASALLPATTGGVYEAEAGDLDGDDDLDLFFLSLERTDVSAGGEGSRMPLGEGPVENRLERGTLAFSKHPAIGADDDNDVALFDYDQDGDLDAFIGSLGPREKVLRNDGGLAFTLVEGVVEPIADPTLALGIADLDGDGAPDLVTVQGLERIGAEQPPCQVFLNGGPRDGRPPRVLAEQELGERATPRGPWVLHAAVQDDVISNGETWITAEAWFVRNEAPRQLGLDLDGSAPTSLDVAAGTTVVWTNTSGKPLRVQVDDGVEPVELAADATWAHTFVRPGKRALRIGDAESSIAVGGEPGRGVALQAGAGLWRFELGDGGQPAGELCYQIVFADRAGNRTACAPRAIELREPRRRERRPRGG